MRICVLSNSSSSGLGLRDPAAAWPRLLAAELGAEGDRCEVREVAFFPRGTKAVDFAMTRVLEDEPELLIVSVGSFICAVGTVSERVRQRWGDRAQRLFLRLERTFDSNTREHGRFVERLNGAGRWLTRRVIGTATLGTVEEVTETFTRLLDLVAQREQLRVIVFPDPYWPGAVVKENPGANRAFEQLRAAVRAAAERHRFDWVDVEPEFSQVPDRDAYYQIDHTHKSVAGHRAIAGRLLAHFTAEREQAGAAEGSARS